MNIKTYKDKKDYSMKNVVVTANRWDKGWELSLDGEVVTQVVQLELAAQQIRDYLDTVEPNVNHADVSVYVQIKN